jgi:hypothetical protein
VRESFPLSLLHKREPSTSLGVRTCHFVLKSRTICGQSTLARLSGADLVRAIPPKGCRDHLAAGSCSAGRDNRSNTGGWLINSQYIPTLFTVLRNWSKSTGF